MSEVDEPEWKYLASRHQRGTWGYLYEKNGRRKRSWTYDSRDAVIVDVDKSSRGGRERIVGLLDPNGGRHQWDGKSRLDVG